MKVIGFGDSNMNGHALLESETWRYHLGQKLGITIENEGVNGENSSEALERLPSILEKKPDLVFLNHASNDVFQTVDKTGKLDLSILEDNMRTIIRTLKESGVHVIYLSPFVHLCGDPVKKTYFYARHDPKNYVHCDPNECLHKAHKSLSKLCEEEDVFYVNLFDDHRLQEPRLFVRTLENSEDEDGSHFSKEGAKLISEVIFDQVSELEYFR